jgi:hypothetical protein
MSAVNKVITNMNRREPFVQAHTNGHSALGGGLISLAGNGFRRFSNQRSIE